MRLIAAVLHSDVFPIVYQAFRQLFVIRAASWPRYIHLRVNTQALLQHVCMQEGFSGVSGVSMSPLISSILLLPGTNVFIECIQTLSLCPKTTVNFLSISFLERGCEHYGTDKTHDYVTYRTNRPL